MVPDNVLFRIYSIDSLSLCSALLYDRFPSSLTQSTPVLGGHLSFFVADIASLPLSSVANPKALFSVSREPSFPVFVLLTLFSVMSPVSGCDLAISSVDF